MLQVTLPALRFMGKPNKTLENQVKQAGSELKKILSFVPMVSGSVGSGKPIIYVGVQDNAMIEAVKSTLRKTPNVVEDSKTQKFSYKGFEIEIFDGIQTLK